MKKLLIAVLLLCCASQAAPRPTIFDNSYFFGPVLDISERRGYNDFSGYTEEQPCNPLTSWGATFGKRWLLNPWLRFQLSGQLSYGTVVDPGDTLPPSSYLGITEPAIRQKKFVLSGLIADLQYPLQLGEDQPVRLYFHAGGGLHVSWYSESEALLYNRSQPVTGDGLLDSNQTMLSASVHAGIGSEWRLSPTIGMSVSYTLRYGYPVHYTQYQDMFPFGAPYSERFISHEFVAAILW